MAPPLGPSCPQTGGGGAATFSGGVGTCPNLAVWFWVSQEKRVRVPCPVSTIFCSHGHTWAEFRGKTWTGHRRSLLDDSGSAERAAGHRGQQRAQAMARAWGPGRPCAGPARETRASVSPLGPQQPPQTGDGRQLRAGPRGSGPFLGEMARACDPTPDPAPRTLQLALLTHSFVHSSSLSPQH